MCLFHRLIEEFMVLANMSVASRIYKSFPEHAVLRRHPVPDVSSSEFNDLVSACNDLGFEVDATSPVTLEVSSI